MGKLKIAEKKNSATVLPIEAYSQISLPKGRGRIDVTKGDFNALSENAQNFIIEHVSLGLNVI